jgi:hypothetical protein
MADVPVTSETRSELSRTTAPDIEAFPGTPVCAFADASGNTDLETDKPGATRFFVLTAVVVRGDRCDALRRAADGIRARYFGPGEMKSSSVGSDDKRRYKIIAELAELDFKFVTLIVDKARLSRDSGLAYKGSFIKFLHDVLFGRLYEAHPDLKLTADEHGSPAFMASFEKYVRDRRPADLFRRPGFAFAPSHSEPLLQIADMISGTVLRLHESESPATVAEPLRALLRLRGAAFIEWPPAIRTVAPLAGASEHDAAVRAFCLSLVTEFITKHVDGADDEVAAQVATLRFLLFHFNAVSEAEFVSTARLRSALEDVGLNPPSEQAMRARVIARLRDHGVIVASSSRGYKIPASVADLIAFVERTDRTVYPMVHRLQRARERISVLTGGELDILRDDRFEYLRTILDAPLAQRAPSPEDEEPLG